MPLKPLTTEGGGSAWHRSLQENPHGAVHCEAPCVGCGTPTRRRAITAVGLVVVHAGDMQLDPERRAWCDVCEAKRNRQQLEGFAANEAVLPRLREEARQQLAAMEAVRVPA